MKRHICTLSDKNYILQGINLYESLITHNKDIILHYLCLDNFILEFLTRQNLPNLKIYDLKDYLDNDEELKNTKNTIEYNRFCWGLASYFCKELLKEYDNILYTDSDIYFYQSLKEIYEEIGNKSIGIIRHRHVEYGSRCGEFNVGIVYFKSDKNGKNCVNFWWDLNKNKTHQYFKTHGHAGDQKYLELFPKLYDKDLCIIENKVGHGAPFNFHLYDYKKFSLTNKKILYKQKEQKISFIHFMKFLPNFINKTYSPTNEPFNQDFMKIKQVKEIYDEYFELLCKTKIKYNL